MALMPECNECRGLNRAPQQVVGPSRVPRAVAKLAMLLMLTPGLVSCVSFQPLSAEKRLLISGILKDSMQHSRLTDEALTDTFKLTPHDFDKSCS
jgi:hypothetical protein